MPRYALAAAAAAAAIGTGLFASTPLWNPPPGCGCNTPTYASADYYVSTLGSDTNSCTSAATPCLTLNGAYQKITTKTPKTVEVACGNYGAQGFSANSNLAGTTAYVTFRPPAGQSTTCWNQTDAITFSGVSPPSYIEISDFAWQGGISAPIYTGNVAEASVIINGGDHIIVDQQNGGSFDVNNSSSNVTIQNSHVGDCKGNSVFVCVPRTTNSGVTNVTIKNTIFSNIRGGTSTGCPPDNVCHTDGLAVFGVNGLTLNADKFYDDDIADIRIQDDSSSAANTVSNITIENTWFGIVWDGGSAQAAIEVDTEVGSGFTVAFNSFSGVADSSGNHANYLTCLGANTLNSTGGSNCGTDTNHAKIYGNLLGGNGGSCPGDADYSYNVFIPFSAFTGQTACGATDTKVSSFPYTTDASTGDINYSITGAAWAGDNSVPTASIPAGWPTTDYFGTTRPLNTNADAGSVERTP